MGSAGYLNDFVTRAALQCRLGIISNDPTEAIYLIAHKDSEGNKLDGANNYTLDFRPEEIPKVEEFWSLTMYDLTNNLVANPINRYKIGSLTENYRKAEDGSLTVYIQNLSPGKDKEANWLPSPKEDFYLVFRTYGPSKSFVEQTWEIPALTKMK